MPLTKMYENRAVMFNTNDYPLGWDNPNSLTDFIAAANEECHYLLPPDWYILGYDENNKSIVVGLERYENRMNLAPCWSFIITAEKTDDDGDNWIIFDVTRFEPTKLYNFQLP